MISGVYCLRYSVLGVSTKAACEEINLNIKNGKREYMEKFTKICIVVGSLYCGVPYIEAHDKENILCHRDQSHTGAGIHQTLTTFYCEAGVATGLESPGQASSHS